MRRRGRYPLAVLSMLLCAFSGLAQPTPQYSLDAAFQSAVSEYNAGRFAAAAKDLRRRSSQASPTTSK